MHASMMLRWCYLPVHAASCHATTNISSASTVCEPSSCMHCPAPLPQGTATFKQLQPGNKVGELLSAQDKSQVNSSSSHKQCSHQTCEESLMAHPRRCRIEPLANLACRYPLPLTTKNYNPLLHPCNCCNQECHGVIRTEDQCMLCTTPTQPPCACEVHIPATCAWYYRLHSTEQAMA